MPVKEAHDAVSGLRSHHQHARADALFASALQRSDEPSAAQVRQAIAVDAFGTRGCAARVAQAYGEHPETAVLRMRWARETVTAAFGGTRPVLPTHPCLPAGAPFPDLLRGISREQLRFGRRAQRSWTAQYAYAITGSPC